MTTILNDWVSRIADNIERNHADGAITVASGLSPSGPIHMGNLREVITTHFVADELRRRGREVRHVLSWDDYDRFRKVPNVAGVDESWTQYIGMPLTSVPAPSGSAYSNWADHFRSEFQDSLRELHIACDEISQTVMYTNGNYTDNIIHAMNNRVALGEIIASFQTKGTVLNANDYYPYQPYCAECGRDTTTVTGWDATTENMEYFCACDFTLVANIREISGKLVWKIDWPMRWAYENVIFEAAGVDHMSPGSSWDAGRLIAPVFNTERPMGQRYSFVGFEGAAKMASSAGGVPTPSMIIPAIGSEMVRWLYARSRPEQAFNIDMINNTSRLYDEWDALTNRVRNNTAKDNALAAYQRATTTVDSIIFDNNIDNNVKFSAWVSFADMSLCDMEQMRYLAGEDNDAVLNSERAERAIYWVNNFMPADQRTHVNSEFNADYYDSLPNDNREAINLLANNLENYWSNLTDLTRWSFGAAKAHLGIDIDDRNLSDEAKAFQREYFVNVYQLLISEDAGPRLPMLMRCIGLDRTRELLTGIRA